MISVIVPMYNTEKTIERCINSILKQSINDLEIILVNDGSEDNTRTICEKYSNNDSRIKLINSENKGVSHARNLGILHSTGKYIGFVDSDDIVDSEMYLSLYNNIKKDNSDISFCAYKLITGHKEIEVKFEEEGKFGYGYISKTFIPKFLSRYSTSGKYQEIYMGSSCRCLFRADLIKNNNIYFNEDVKLAEDLIFLIKCLNLSNTISISNESLYNYMLNNINESTTQKFIDKGYYETIKVQYYIEEILENSNYFNSYKKTFDYRYVYDFWCEINNLCKTDCILSFKQKIDYINKIDNEFNLSNYIKGFKLSEMYGIVYPIRVLLKLKSYRNIVSIINIKNIIRSIIQKIQQTLIYIG